MARVIPTTLRNRRDIYELQLKYDDKKSTDEDRKPMEKLLWAFHSIQNINPPTAYNSFFTIAGYHGMPFRGAGWGNPSWWGGYCNHGNVLFPTWHRGYVLRLEDALRSIKGCEDVALPYWNEMSQQTIDHGIPTIFLRDTVTISASVAGTKEKITIPNPLRSYKFQDGVWDNLATIPDADYSKPKGYETKRYPFSGLVGTQDAAATEQHNKFVALLTEDGTNKLLNENVVDWLGESITISSGQVLKTNTAYKYRQCLEAPTYTVFSNTTSAQQYNEDLYYQDNPTATQVPDKPNLPVVPLESPHNDMHLAVGGFDIPGQGNFDWVMGANGDMGENDTASFDPIFWFHHCFIDKVFWDWQKKWKAQKTLTIDVGYPGTNSTDAQGPTPGIGGNTWLTMDTPLAPFTKGDKEGGVPLTSNDVVDIENQLGYTYDEGQWVPDQMDYSKMEPQVVRVSGINRATIPGSFSLVVTAEVDGKEQVIGTESILSRWRVSGCANCQTHMGVKAFVPLAGLKNVSSVKVGMNTREKKISNINESPVPGGWRIGKLGPQRRQVV